MPQGVEKGFLGSLELAGIPRKRPDQLDAFGDQFRRGPELLVESILSRGRRLELPVEAILPPRDGFENRLDALEPLSDFRFHEKHYISARRCSGRQAEIAVQVFQIH